MLNCWADEQYVAAEVVDKSERWRLTASRLALPLGRSVSREELRCEPKQSDCDGFH